jgi:tetratricopeptide (TPR) repeat protein
MTDAPDGKRDFFVSFTQADRAWATWIAWALEEAGYSVWFQDWDFKGNFVLEMDKAHKLSRRTVAVLSPDYLASRFAAPEWAARFAQDATSEHDLLIPVRVRPCALEGLLGQIVYVDLVGCDEAAARDRLLRRVEGIRLKPHEPPLFPGSPQHEAVPERPSFPSGARSAPAPPPGGAGSWIARHKEIAFGGTGAAVLGALLTWWLGAAPTQTSVDIKNDGGQVGPVVTGPVAGDVIGQQTTVHGVPFDEYKQIRDELGVTDEALASFFAIVERERVPRHELEPTLRDIARRYKELLARLETPGSADREVQHLKEQARDALRAGDFDRAEELLNQAKARDLSAIERMEADLDARKLSAAEAAAANGDLMMTQIRYAAAARYYAEAVGLTPEKYAEQLSERLTGWTEAAWRAGDYRTGLDEARRALALDEARLPADDARLGFRLNNLALLYQATGRYAEAEPLYARAFAIDEKTLGPEHPDVAQSLNNLAELYRATGRYGEAEPLYRRAIAVLEKSLRPDHPHLMWGLENYASLLDRLGRGGEAGELWARAEAIRSRRKPTQTSSP